MRSNPKKPNPNKGKVALVLAILAIIWLVVGTLTMMKIKDVIINGTYEIYQDDMQTENGDDQDNAGDVTDDIDDSDDQDEDDGLSDADGDGQNENGVGDADEGFDDDDTDTDGGINDDDDANDQDDDDTDADDDNADDDNDDADDEDDDEDDDIVTLTVNAWDGFAAVRTGRGTNYAEVGRINNGKKVKVTDLENGWYKIASGKWKGNYLHKSSLS